MITLGNKQLCEYCLTENCGEPCRFCGFDKANFKAEVGALPPGSVLSGKYIVGKIIGKGGFGITYLAYDIKREKQIALKEYYPITYAVRGHDGVTVIASRSEDEETYKTGMEKFYEEASLVSKFNGNPNIVSVYEFFYENDTAYFVMELLHGVSLKAYIDEQGCLSPEEMLYIANEVSNALMVAHSANVLHRDVSPDNIMLCSDGKVKLIDFGAARQVAADNPKSMSVILKQGFAPLEQYQRRGKQGPWTDIYSLGATLYYAATKVCLDDPMSRLDDDSEFQANIHGIEPQMWEIITHALNIKVDDRYKSAFEFREALNKIAYKPVPIKIELDEQERKAVPIAAAVGAAQTAAGAAAQSIQNEQTGQTVQTAQAVPPAEYAQSSDDPEKQPEIDDFVPRVAEPAEKKPLNKKLIAILSSAIGVILVAGITLIAVTLSKSKNSINVKPGNNDPQNSAVQSANGDGNNTEVNERSSSISTELPPIEEIKPATSDTKTSDPDISEPDNDTPVTSSSSASSSSSSKSSSSSTSSSKSSSSSTTTSSSKSSSSSTTTSSSKSSSSSTTTSSSKSSSSSTTTSSSSKSSSSSTTTSSSSSSSKASSSSSSSKSSSSGTPEITSVKIGNDTYNTNWEGWVDVAGDDLTNQDIKNLQYLTEVSCMNISDNKRITDISPVKYCTKLEWILMGPNVSDLSPLYNLKKLEILDIDVGNDCDLDKLLSTLSKMPVGSSELTVRLNSGDNRAIFKSKDEGDAYAKNLGFSLYATYYDEFFGQTRSAWFS